MTGDGSSRSGNTVQPASNLFCRSSDLSNEASVEAFFVLRLLRDLGYEDHEILPKKAIQELKIPKGRARELYRPDFLIKGGGSPRWLIDAKGTDERIEDYTYQCAGYSLLVNRKYEDRPLRYFMLTNGLLTRVYPWDQEEAILSLRFSDFALGNAKYETLLRLLGAKAVREGWRREGKPTRGHVLTRPSMDTVKKAFAGCHRVIWKAEKMSPEAAFVEFAKLLFVKLWEDRKLRDNPDTYELISKGDPLPKEAVKFSTAWVEQQEAHTPSPVDSILFRQLVDVLEEEIAQRKRKRIFPETERLDLAPGTIKRVVEKLEHYYLFGIDEDLNGRMFEAFLAATMRGQALGQYFTPRSIVKLITRLAAPLAERDQVERVLDACCGTGGFLIEALTVMRRQLHDNGSLSHQERIRLLNEVANEAIFGIDAGRQPRMSRIARINMYLHGDGGSRVYMTDGLRRVPEASEADQVEVREEVKELRELLDTGTLFDVVLTNPPFSMDYSFDVPEEAAVLQGYDLADYQGRRRKSLRSSIMFIERYWQLLRPGGRLLTVIDDSVLGGNSYGFVRDFIRDRFVIRAVISLHGDAFQRAGARAKTSVLYLEKRGEGINTQPDAFVFESLHIGRDDVVQRTPPSVAEQARLEAAREADEIVAAFAQYLRGEKGPWLVPPERVTGRLDAKFLLPWSVVKLEPRWREVGAGSDILANLVDPISEAIELDPNAHYEFLRISYEGVAEHGERRLGKEVTYSKVNRAEVGDIVVSHISAVYRAICVMSEEMEDTLISNEFTILRPKPDVEVDAYYLWSVLRTAGVIAEWLSGASGVGRHRVDWDLLQDQRVPLLPYPEQQKIGDMHREAIRLVAEAKRHQQEALAAIAGLDLESEVARDRLARAKPPR